MPARQLAQLLQGGVELGAGAVEQPLRGVRVVAHPVAREAHAERHRYEPLLGAVVQVALEAATLLEPDAQHARARVAQLRHLRAQLGVEALVLERHRGGRADRVQLPRR